MKWGLVLIWIQASVLFGQSVPTISASVWQMSLFAQTGVDCPEDDTCLHLRNNRFHAVINYRKAGDTNSKPGHGVSLKDETGFDETGFFWFEDADNIDAIVRVFDGCAFTDHFWVFAAALTKVEYDLTVTDSQTGLVKTYSNDLGQMSPPIQDTQAFATCPSPKRILAEGDKLATLNLSKEGQALDLIENRFKVDVVYSIPDMLPGKGTVGVETNTSGAFWFLDPSDLNLYVRVIDGRAINGHYWFAYTSFTGAEYALRVTDTLTNVVKTYNNPLNESTFGMDMFLTEPGGSELVYPWVSNSDRFDSTLITNNNNCLPVDVQLEARRNDGTSQIVERVIPPGGFLEEAAADLFPELGTGSGYSVLVSSPQAGLFGRWVTNNRDTPSMNSPSQGVAIHLPDQITLPLPPNAQVGNAILFGYLPVKDNFFSAPVVVNVGDAPTDISFDFFSPEGHLILHQKNAVTGLMPFQPFAAVTSDLVPDLTYNLSMVAYSNDQPLTGVVFVFNSLGEPALGNATAISYTGLE